MSEHRYVLDSSIVLANLLEEPGSDAIEPIMLSALISSVNLCEIVTKLQERGMPDSDIDLSIAELDLNVIPFGGDHALAAGKLRAATRAAGLSLGDRACLALAMAEAATAITMDRAWSKLDLPVAIEIARP